MITFSLGKGYHSCEISLNLLTPSATPAQAEAHGNNTIPAACSALVLALLQRFKMWA
jgi:hypothetical protein